MSDETEKPETKKRGSIPAPVSVPRPSRPPNTPSEPAPVSNRKGTLDGIQPRTAAAFSYHEPNDEEFDAEKTMVVDPDDDAPTADYDPRTMQHAYDPRARGVYTSSGRTSATPPVALEAPTIPAAPPTPTFDAVPVPRASEMGRRRTSRRTVKIPEDQIKRIKPAETPAHLQSQVSVAADELPADLPPRVEPRADVPDLSFAADTPSDGSTPLGAEDHDSISEEITVVKPLRIISIGSDPPPPIRSALATWPPTAPFQGLAPEVDAGWTPAAPEVVANAASLPEPEQAAPATEPTPALGAQPVVEDPARISEIPLSERDEILEDIEPDAAPFAAPAAQAPAAAQQKKPPPPPPKTRAQDTKPGDTPKKGKPWWEDLFTEEYIRTHDRLDEKVVKREVDFIEESLGMEKHAVVLDLACGMGDHAIDFAARGYNVVGLDNSAGMLAIADRSLRGKLRNNPNQHAPTFVQADMRDLHFEESFDGVYCWSTSFGFFEEEKNLMVLQHVHRALRQGGMFLLEVINRDYVAPRSPSLVWFEGQQCVCMDDMYVDFFTSRLRVKRTAMFEGGLSRELDYSIRLYTLHELGKLLHEVGFKVVEVTGHPAHPGVFFGTESPRLIVLSERS